MTGWSWQARHRQPRRQDHRRLDHIDARRRTTVILDAMRSAGRIDHPTTMSSQRTRTARSLQRHRSKTGVRRPCRVAAGSTSGTAGDDKAAPSIRPSAPLLQRISNISSGHLAREAAVLYAGFDQIVGGAAGLKGLPEPPPPSVEGQNPAIRSDHDQ